MTKLYGRTLTRVWFALFVVIGSLNVMAPACSAENSVNTIQPVRTDSPRHTFESFLRLGHELDLALVDYRVNRTWANRILVSRIGEEVLSLIDLSAVPEVSQRERGIETGTFLLDILGRIKLPALDEVPTAEDFYNNPAKPARWHIPNTPIEIVRVGQGPREGEFLFSGQTVITAPRFYQNVRDMPLRSQLGIKSWSEALPQLTGPMIPAGLVRAVPDLLKRPWLDTPIWKVFGVVLLSTFAIIFLAIWHRIVMLMKSESEPLLLLRGLPTPVMAIFAFEVLWAFVTFELNVEGLFAAAFNTAITLAKFLAAAWLFWLFVLIVVEFILRSPKTSEQSLDASLLRLCARIIGIVGGIVILAYAASNLGLPVFSVIAGLGIGGLAVALAIRPTLENLIGGLILYADRPVRVGDYCKFSDYVGTVENIGVRSTKLRALDRTLISVPNAKLADMEIVNWAHCDQMLINTTIGLRYETKPDQLRHIIATIREMLYAHPKVDNETVRVRFAGFGASSLDINIRIYLLTREWNEYYAIQEDVFLRVSEIVDQSGTGFAFPSRTVYFRRDEGLDEERSKAASEQVAAWRRSGKLPFPQMSPSQVDELAGTLDYPPRGSPDSLLREPQEAVSPERLSAEAPEPASEHPLEAERENPGVETQSDPEGRDRDKDNR